MKRRIWNRVPGYPRLFHLSTWITAPVMTPMTQTPSSSTMMSLCIQCALTLHVPSGFCIVRFENH